jgi:hypothetical protein
MQLTLVLTNKTSQEVTESLIELEDQVVFGRHLGSPMLFEGDAISRQHFSIELKDGRAAAANLSSNGTMLNGIPLQGQESMLLVTGDILAVPGYEIRVELAGEDASGAASPQRGSANNVPVWNKVLRTAVGFFDPLEVLLLLCAIATIALTMYYFTS